ncbi:GtrA family protein [Marinobacter sp. S0848L]|uniref:GtrA family protein n=1 Tax=Marinobacter sp. S0848L TaxID=2926423 RepID=UPI001FF1920C|nr:GtrA family protein [Marinobacter sp. S0848L]MCK0107245.1 GtrA family protein [Marinobacter sp. S0848L]
MSIILSRQFQGFVAAGGLATLLHWLVMASLIGTGLAPVLATACGSVSGAVLNYSLQRCLAFRSAGPHSVTLIRYISACFGAWFCNLGFFFLLSSFLALPVTLSQIVTTALVAALNYIVYQRLVFHEQTL